MHLFPAIDLRNGKVVRLHKGDYDQETTYETNPVLQAQTFAEAGATWLHVVDLDGARSGQMVHLEVIRQICKATQLRVEVGGGVRTTDAIDQLFSVGVSRVILGTAALDNWSWFKELMADSRCRGRLVLGLDAREGKLAVRGWQRQLEATALDVARKVSDWPLAAIVYTDIATDGTLRGPNIEATQQIAEATQVPVVASGGVGTLDHLRTLRQLPIQGAIVGKALYDKAIDIYEAITVFEQGA